MTPLEPEELNELASFLKDTEESLSALGVGDGEKEMEKSRRCLLSFHSTAAMLGLESLEKAGVELEKFLISKVSPGNIDSISVLGFAVSTVIDQMRTFGNGNGGAQIDLDEILEILGQSETTEKALDDGELPLVVSEICETIDETPEKAPNGTEDSADFSDLAELAKNLGGELLVSSDGDTSNLSFSGSAESLKRIEKLLFATGPSDKRSLQKIHYSRMCSPGVRSSLTLFPGVTSPARRKSFSSWPNNRITLRAFTKRLAVLPGGCTIQYAAFSAILTTLRWIRYPIPGTASNT